MYHKAMIRKSYFITEQQDKILLELKEKTGLTFSEIVRRALDHYLVKLMAENNQAKTLA